MLPAALPEAKSLAHILANPGQWFLVGVKDPRHKTWSYCLDSPKEGREEIMAAADHNEVFCPQRQGDAVEWVVTAMPPKKKNGGSVI